MITPVFWITQEADFLIIRIRAPHASLAELDYDHGQQMFIFSCQPYFLRLHLKQMVEEYASGRGSVNYDTDEGEFLIRVPKIHRGEHFTDLDMITELLRPSREVHGRGMVEEIDGEEAEGEEEDDEEGDEFLAEQLEVRDIGKEIIESEKNVKEFGYGFGWTKVGIIERLREEIGKIVDLQYPENVKIENRKAECSNFDFEAFDEGRYLADTLEPEDELVTIIASEFQTPIKISDEDREKLKDISTKKKIKLTKSQNDEVATSLVDIIFAYCYDQRVNDWDATCESGWTCAKLSPSISFLLNWNKNANEAIIGAVRRSISYPLYRSWDLATKVVEDTKKVFEGGRSAILHILCDIHRIFVNSGEFRYILNDIFITDYLIWIQSVEDDTVSWIQKQVAELRTVEKKDIDWGLEVLELEARMGNAEIDSDDD